MKSSTYLSASRIKRWVPVLFRSSGIFALIILSAYLGGCASSITGGGVPLGGTRAELSGQVVQASDQSQVVAGSTVTLQASDGQTYITTSDSAGNYQFPSVPLGAAVLKVLPPASQHLRDQELRVVISADSTGAVVAALLPDTANLVVTGITLKPPSLALRPGDRAVLTVTIQGQNVPQGSEPSLVVSGGVGQVLPHGVFLATHRGAGSITASFGDQTASIPVTVQ